MKTREGTYDGYILKEIQRTYGWMNVKDRKVMDIGGCFGAASVFFVQQGATSVTVYEPEQENFSLLKENITGFPITAINAAVSDHDGELKFYVNDSGVNKGTHTVRPTRGRKEVSVDAVNFWTELERIKPDVLKVDCEGGEYVFYTKQVPEYVKEVCLEIHRTNDDYREKAYELVSLFDEEHWECVKKPKLDGGHWATIGGWRRK